MKEKKCKVCKEVFTPIRNLQIVCSPTCSYEYLKRFRLKEWAKKKKKIKKESMTIQQLLQIVQQVFNKWIRKRDAGCKCISCQKKAKKENAGHYFSSGGHRNVTLNEDNVHLQCEYCNTFKHGNLVAYGINLIKKIGKERYDALLDIAYDIKKFTREELLDKLEYYKKKLK